MTYATISLRIPADLYEQVKEAAYQRRQSATQLIIGGVRMTLGETVETTTPSSPELPIASTAVLTLTNSETM